MGITYAKVTIKNITAPKRSFTEQFLVDTGATDTLVPARLLRQIGIRPTGRRTYALATGRRRYRVGHALFALEGDETAGDVVFGKDEDEPLLGLTVLESLGLVVDPVRRRLVRVEGIPLKRITRKRNSSSVRSAGSAR
ncbi:MAG: retroviral-like aspartic protease family protein [Planctomycetes bacterium]|nr:retroviral-like aspartic protease family protein [Planctomycetota bacterium]